MIRDLSSSEFWATLRRTRFVPHGGWNLANSVFAVGWLGTLISTIGFSFVIYPALLFGMEANVDHAAWWAVAIIVFGIIGLIGANFPESNNNNSGTGEGSQRWGRQ